MGQNGAVVGQVSHFGPFSFKKSAKGVPKRVEIQIFTKSGFQHVKRFLITKEVLLF
jgi:hypothetical protein